jgi:hypothetical protein
LEHALGSENTLEPNQCIEHQPVTDVSVKYYKHAGPKNHFREWPHVKQVVLIVQPDDPGRQYKGSLKYIAQYQVLGSTFQNPDMRIPAVFKMVSKFILFRPQNGADWRHKPPLDLEIFSRLLPLFYGSRMFFTT